MELCAHHRVGTADQPPSTYSCGFSQVPPSIFGVLTVLTAALLVAALYFAREVQIPEYRSNLEAKIRTLPEVVPGGGLLHRVTNMVQELGRELKKSEAQTSISPADRSAIGTAPVEQA